MSLFGFLFVVAVLEKKKKAKLVSFSGEGACMHPVRRAVSPLEGIEIHAIP
jgi:hypothetical protein